MNEIKMLRDRCDELEERINYIISSRTARDTRVVSVSGQTARYKYSISQKAGTLAVEIKSANGVSVAAAVKLDYASEITSSGSCHYIALGELSSGEYSVTVTLSAISGVSINAILELSAPQLIVTDIVREY